ncbi:unnamed protein product, partial [Meganyctiphanes norvegica]
QQTGSMEHHSGVDPRVSRGHSVVVQVTQEHIPYSGRSPSSPGVDQDVRHSGARERTMMSVPEVQVLNFAEDEMVPTALDRETGGTILTVPEIQVAASYEELVPPTLNRVASSPANLSSFMEEQNDLQDDMVVSPGLETIYVTPETLWETDVHHTTSSTQTMVSQGRVFNPTTSLVPPIQQLRPHPPGGTPSTLAVSPMEGDSIIVEDVQRRQRSRSVTPQPHSGGGAGGRRLSELRRLSVTLGMQIHGSLLNLTSKDYRKQ